MDVEAEAEGADRHRMYVMPGEADGPERFQTASDQVAWSGNNGRHKNGQLHIGVSRREVYNR